MSNNLDDYVLLKCPDCGKILPAKKLEHDPPNTRRILIRCEECNTGDFDTERYFDKEGNEL